MSFEARLAPLVAAQFDHPTNNIFVLSRKKLEKIAYHVSIYIKHVPINDELLQAKCFAKAVLICEKACSDNDFKSVEALAAHVVALKSLQGKTVYEVLFSHIGEKEYQNLLTAISKNSHLRSWLEKDLLYKTHQERLAVLETILDAPATAIRKSIDFCRELLLNPRFHASCIIRKDPLLKPVFALTRNHKLPLVEALAINDIAKQIKTWKHKLKKCVATDERLQKLLESKYKWSPTLSNRVLRISFLVIESMHWTSKEKIALAVRIINEGWKNIIDEAKYKIPQTLRSAACLEINNCLVEKFYPYKSIKTLAMEEGLTLYVLEKKKINKQPDLNWQYKVVSIAAWSFDENVEKTDIIGQLRAFAEEKNCYDAHIVITKKLSIEQSACVDFLHLAALRVFKCAVEIHTCDLDSHDFIGGFTGATFHIDGKLELPESYNRQSYKYPIQEWTSKISQKNQIAVSEKESFEVTYPSYFDRSKIVSDDRWAVTFVNYTEMFIEGIVRGTRFRIIIDFNKNLNFENSKNWIQNGQYLYYTYGKRGTLSVKYLKYNEQLSFEIKSDTKLEESVSVKELIKLAEGVHSNKDTISELPNSVIEQLENGELPRELIKIALKELCKPPVFRFFCRKSRQKNEVKVFKIDDKELQNLLDKNESLFFYLVDRAFIYNEMQLRDYHLNPFTGEDFIDTQRIVERFENPQPDVLSNITFFGAALLNDISTYFFGTTNPAVNLESRGIQDKQANAFREEMSKVERPVIGCPYGECRNLILSIKKNLQSFEFKRLPISSFSILVDWEELVQHIVLVHAFSHHSVGYHFPVEIHEFREKNDIVGLMTFVLSHVLTNDGIIGKKIADSDRPQIHWSWNQLVQPHGNDSSWENTEFAILEPLANLERTTPPFGLAPYDTMTGSLKLSKYSIILIPDIVEGKAREYFGQSFQGKIVTYKFSSGVSIRQAIFETMNKYYPNIWHIGNENEDSTASKEIHTKFGYFEKTYLKTPSGQSYHIMDKRALDSESLSPILKEAEQSGRFFGLHAYFPTNKLEKSTYFQLLLSFKNNPSIVRGKKYFIGNDGLDILQALDFYNDLNRLDKRTKMGEFGEHVFDIALQADITSLIFSRKEGDLTFDSSELIVIAHSIREPAIKELSRIKKSEKKERDNYLDILLNAITCMKKAKERIVNLSIPTREGLPYYLDDIIWGSSLQEEWSRLFETLNGSLDLKNQWSLTNEEKDFITKVNYLLQGHRISSLEAALDTSRKMSGVVEDSAIREKFHYLIRALEIFLKKHYYLEFMNESDVASF